MPLYIIIFSWNITISIDLPSYLLTLDENTSIWNYLKFTEE